jgi:hypothetical protein
MVLTSKLPVLLTSDGKIHTYENMVIFPGQTKESTGATIHWSVFIFIVRFACKYQQNALAIFHSFMYLEIVNTLY